MFDIYQIARYNASQLNIDLQTRGADQTVPTQPSHNVSSLTFRILHFLRIYAISPIMQNKPNFPHRGHAFACIHGRQDPRASEMLHLPAAAVTGTEELLCAQNVHWVCSERALGEISDMPARVPHFHNHLSFKGLHSNSAYWHASCPFVFPEDC